MLSFRYDNFVNFQNMCHPKCSISQEPIVYISRTKCLPMKNNTIVIECQVEKRFSGPWYRYEDSLYFKYVEKRDAPEIDFPGVLVPNYRVANISWKHIEHYTPTWRTYFMKSCLTFVLINNFDINQNLRCTL